MRRLRRTETLRGLVRETELSPAHLIQPVFVVAGEGVREEVESMPGIERFSISDLVEEAGEIAAAGVGAVLLFGIPAAKDESGSGAYDDEGIVQMAVRALKEAHPDLTVITDVCLCEYTSHGHCGFVRERRGRQRHHGRAAGQNRDLPRRGRRRRGRAERHDGRPDRLDPLPARRGGPLRRADRRLQRQVRLRLLRALPRRRRLDPGVRRPPRLPDGSGQRRRSGARGRARPRRGRRHADGQARDPLPRRRPPGQGRDRRAASPPTTSPASTRC